MLDMLQECGRQPQECGQQRDFLDQLSTNHLTGGTQVWLSGSMLTLVQQWVAGRWLQRFIHLLLSAIPFQGQSQVMWIASSHLRVGVTFPYSIWSDLSPLSAPPQGFYSCFPGLSLTRRLWQIIFRLHISRLGLMFRAQNSFISNNYLKMCSTSHAWATGSNKIGLLFTGAHLSEG